PTALLFFRELLRDQALVPSRIVNGVIALSAILFIVSLSPWGATWGVRALVISYATTSLLFVAQATRHRIRRSRSEADRMRLRYLLYSGAGAMALAAGELVPSSEVPAALGHIAVTFYVYFLYQSIIARRLIDLVELLGKAAVLAVLTLVLATIYFLLVRWVGADQQGLWLFNTLVASFVILILYDQIRPWVENLTSRLLFRERYELQRVVRQLLRQLRTTISTREMREKTLEALYGTERATHVAIYLAEEGELSFVLSGYRGEEQPPDLLSISTQPQIVHELRRERRPILLEHLLERADDLPTLVTDGDPTSRRELERADEALGAMRSLRSNAIVPMLADDRIVGILTLGIERPSDAYSTAELTALLSTAEACAVVITNSREYERLRERDRLVAIGEMAAGMAHEIRNPLGAIKGAAQCMDPTLLPEQSVDFLRVITEEVDRLNGVVEQFLAYAKPYRGSPIPTDVNSVVAATLRLLSHEGVPSNIEVGQNLAHALPRISVDPEQLKQVLINLILNGVQAMPSGGKLTVSTLVAHRHRDLGNIGHCALDTEVCV
ncbi:MAG: GAF domain-containing protein, partial [Planctomycetales bacterium]|nr:GAF domain-containing protein [Planctomycetales bacterium]